MVEVGKREGHATEEIRNGSREEWGKEGGNDTRESTLAGGEREGHTSTSSKDFHTIPRLSDDISGAGQLKSRSGDGYGCGRIACNGLMLLAFLWLGQRILLFSNMVSKLRELKRI